MATAAPLFSTDEYETCTFCLSKHDRSRPSFCQCKHCSIPLCLDCMREHHEELLQSVAQISHQYNELQELLQKKRTMIVDETTKSIEDVNQYFEMYINELRQTQQKIIADTENAKQNAQNCLSEVCSNLQNLGTVIQAMSKDNVFRPTKLEHLSIELKKLEQQIHTFQVKKKGNLMQMVPKFSLEFECLPVSAPDTLLPVAGETKTVVQAEIQESAPQETPRYKWVNLKLLKKPVIQPLVQPNRCREDDDNNTQGGRVITSYDVDRMASDGKNILYTSYYDEEADLIAYCLIDKNIDSADEFRDWKQARIEDMIWWGSIEKFICGTNDGIYTVDYANGRFKITCVLRGKWSYTRVTANTHQLFVWLKSTENNFHGLEVYSTEFKCTRTIDFNTRQIGPFADKSDSFCVTENIIASVYTRKQNKREVFQVVFCDMDMNKLYSVFLGECDSDIEIRTDGKDRFFITTGRHHFYIVRSNGRKRKINLQDDGIYIAVLKNQRVAISNERNNIEIITY